MISVHTQEKIAKFILWMSGFVIIGLLLFILGYVLSRGIWILNWEFITELPRVRGTEGGIFPMIIGTLFIIIISVAMAAPIGIGGGIYLTEYAGKTTLTKFITFGAEWLAGIPSIIFGLFGFAFFVVYLGWGWSLMAGSATLACMILNEIIRTTQESLKMVPNSYRDGSYALGATKWQTIKGVVLKNAAPGILTGIILGIGRSAGDTAAILLTAGTVMRIPETIFYSVRPMSIHLYILAMFEFGEGADARSYGTATLLILIILILNLTAWKIMKIYTKSLRE